MKNWEELVDNCATDKQSASAVFRVAEDVFEDRAVELEDIQKAFNNNELTRAEFTASMIALGRTENEQLYLAQMSGAKIFEILQRDAYSRK